MSRTPDVTDALVGRRIGERRLALGLSQMALASQLGVSAQKVQKYEAGANRISASRLSDIAAALGVGPGALFPDRTLSSVSGGQSNPVLGDLELLTSTPEGRAVAAAFPRIRDKALKQAIARIAEALGPAS